MMRNHWVLATLLLCSLIGCQVGCEYTNPEAVDSNDHGSISASPHAAVTSATPLPLGAGMNAGETVYDEHNIKDLIGDGEKVFAGGEFRYLSRKLPPKAEQEKRLKQFRELHIQKIPRNEWPDRIKAQSAAKARVSDFCDFAPYDQNGTNYCWANGPCQAFTTMRRIQGLPLRIVSSASIAGPITGYRNIGGWELDALEYLVATGATTTDLWPNNGISRGHNTQAVSDDRINYHALEWVECNSFDEFATLALEGCPGAVAYNWWRHVVMLCDLVEISPGKFGFRERNSWGTYGDKNELGFSGFFILAEGKGTPSSGFMLRQVTPSVPKMQMAYSAPIPRKLVVFSASTWTCEPCVRLQRELDKLAALGWEIQKYDDVHDAELAKQMGVKTVPVTFAYLGEKIVERIEGFKTANEIAARANSHTLDKETRIFRRRMPRGRCIGGGCFTFETDYPIAA